MNTKIDELTKSRAQSATCRAALKEFSVGVATMNLACSGPVDQASFVNPNSQAVLNTKLLSSQARKLAAALWLMTIGTASPQTGIPLWTNVYNGQGNSLAQASASAVDSSGNAFVTGQSFRSSENADYATIKYSGAGVALWTNYYDGAGNGFNSATAMAVDGSGNVVVTGFSVGSSSSADYATIKYSGAGVPLWTNRYNGPGNYIDHATAVAVDAHGNAFVTGYSDGGSTREDYATVAYSGLGVPLWTNRYDGPWSGPDQATAVAVDGSGNVFVTGYSVGSAGNFDYATIKYSGEGLPLWANRYDGNGHDFAYAMAVDGSGNVVVTGSSSFGGSYDYATIKYSGTGVTLWTNRFKAQNYGEQAAALAVDSSGNVFVTGIFNTIGGVSSVADYVTMAYSSAGVPLWTNYYSGPANNNFATAIAVDGSGNVIVTGCSASTNTYPNNLDYVTIAYSGVGMPLWTNRYNGPGDGDDYAAAIAVDGSGNVFVTGYSLGSAGNFGYTTIKYSGATLSPILLNYQILGNQLVLSWTNAAFSLHSAPSINGAFTNISGASSPFTNPVSGPQQYFLLKAN